MTRIGVLGSSLIHLSSRRITLQVLALLTLAVSNAFAQPGLQDFVKSCTSGVAGDFRAVAYEWGKSPKDPRYQQVDNVGILLDDLHYFIVDGMPPGTEPTVHGNIALSTAIIRYDLYYELRRFDGGVPGCRIVVDLRTGVSHSSDRITLAHEVAPGKGPNCANPSLLSNALATFPPGLTLLPDKSPLSVEMPLASLPSKAMGFHSQGVVTQHERTFEQSDNYSWIEQVSLAQVTAHVITYRFFVFDPESRTQRTAILKCVGDSVPTGDFEQYVRSSTSAELLLAEIELKPMESTPSWYTIFPMPYRDFTKYRTPDGQEHAVSFSPSRDASMSIFESLGIEIPSILIPEDVRIEEISPISAYKIVTIVDGSVGIVAHGLGKEINKESPEQRNARIEELVSKQREAKLSSGADNLRIGMIVAGVFGLVVAFLLGRRKT